MCSIAQQLKDCIDDLDNIEILDEKEDYLIIEDNIINKKMKLTGHYLKDYNVEIDNSKIVKFKDYGFKFGNYIEVLIEYYSVLDYDTDSAILTDFAIGDVIVSISKPSDLFSVVMRELESDKYYDKDIMWTISLKGITNENYEEYLTQAIFLFGYYNASTCSNDYPHTYEFLGEEYYRYAMDEDELINRRKKNKEFEELEFSLCRYPEALSFYNAGMEISSYEISFQYFYKVLEYFFLITRQDEFINFISNSNFARKF